MTDREPDRGAEDRSGASPDPVNHRPPEEWRPGDPGDPARGGPQPPGEPPHERPQGFAPGEHPTGAPPEPITGEYSEGPSGASQAGFEHAGYAPGYGEADEPAAGPGSVAPIGQPWSGTGGSQTGPQAAGQTGPQAAGQTGPQIAQPGWSQPPAYGQPGGVYAPPPGHAQGAGYGQGTGYPQGAGYGQATPAGYGSYAYGQPAEKSTPWGKIVGIGCGALLLVMLVSAVVSVLMIILVGVGPR